MITLVLDNSIQLKMSPTTAGEYDTPTQVQGFNVAYFKLRAGDKVVGYGIRNISTVPVYFKRLQVTGIPVVPFPGSQWLPGGVLDYIPYNVEHLRRSQKPGYGLSSVYHFIAPDEVIPIITDFEVFRAPSGPERVSLSKAVKNELYDVWSESPRISKFLKMFSFAPRDKATHMGNRNMGWMVNNWQSRNGGEPRKGWFKNIAVRGGDGYHNGHYFAGSWLFHNWLHNHDEPNDTWHFAVAYAIQLAYSGRAHRGKFSGMSYYEKADAFYGDYSIPQPEKQFDWNLLLPYMIGNEKLRAVLQPVVDEHYQHWATVDAARIYDGYWGCRKARFGGESLLAAYLVHGRPSELLDQLVILLNDTHGHYDDSLGFWPNIPAPNVVSPWQQFALIGFMWRCINKLPELDGRLNFNNQWLMNAFERMYEMGMEEFTIKQFDGKLKVCKYRINPDYIANCNVHRNASVYVPLRYAAKLNPGKWGDEFRDFETKLFYYAGSPLWKISPDYEATYKPGFNQTYGKGIFDAWDIHEIGYDFGPEGLGFEKALSFYNMISMAIQ